MKKQISVTLLRFVGSLTGLLAIIAVMCLLGLLFLVIGLPHPEKQLSLVGTAAVSTLFLCGLTALLFHKAHTLEAQLSLAEQSEQAVKRTRRELLLVGMVTMGLSGFICTYEALHDIYSYYAVPALARSVSPVSFWIPTLLYGIFGIGQLLAAANLLRSDRSTVSETTITKD